MRKQHLTCSAAGLPLASPGVAPAKDAREVCRRQVVRVEQVLQNVPPHWRVESPECSGARASGPLMVIEGFPVRTIQAPCALCKPKAGRRPARGCSGRHSRAAKLITERGAAPSPLRRFSRQLRFQRVTFDIPPGADGLRFIPHVGVPIILIPELAASPQQPVRLLGREGFPTPNHPAQRLGLLGKQHMDVMNCFNPGSSRWGR